MDQIIDLIQQNQAIIVLLLGMASPFVTSFFKRYGVKAKYILLLICLAVAIIYYILTRTIGVDAIVAGLTRGFAVMGIAVGLYEVLLKKYLKDV